ncbi:hypothetical protein R6Q57_002619 [Mikania cordata]
MIRFNILEIALVVLVVILHPCTKAQVISVVPATPFSPRPLCNYQMALANQACAYLPFVQIPPPAPRAPYDPQPSDDDNTPEPESEHIHVHVLRHGDDEYPDHDPSLDHDHDHDHDHDNDDDHDHDHDDDHDHDHEHEGGHQHHHHHHHRHHRHRDTPVEEQCCKWLAQVDDLCVCELLVHLPPFLSRPVHNYAVVIGRACNFTFSCGSGLWK